MQMRRLHWVLLIFLVGGCGSDRLSVFSDYVKKNKDFRNRDRLAFALNTADDGFNQAFAVLSQSLVDTEFVATPQTLLELERWSLMSRGRWLMTRASSAGFGGGTALQNDRNAQFRWGYRAIDAVLNYGQIGDQDSLNRVIQDALESLSRLHAEYVGSSPEILERNVGTDSVTEAASAQLRYAALMLFGAKLCDARGDEAAEETYRADANRALKAGRNLFREAARRYEISQARAPKAKLGDFLKPVKVKEDTTDEEDFAELMLEPPDTTAYVKAGVLSGFELLSANPRALVRSEDLLDGFAWLRWNEWRMRDSVKLLETEFLDSATALILAGPSPGYLTEQPYRPGAISPAVMYEFVRQLSELYLGVEPNMLQRKVKVAPRLPASWGHTVARVPLGQGYLFVDYDFPNMRAEVWMENVCDSLAVEFGYPYPSGGWLTAQFELTRKKNRQLVRGEMDGTRLRLVVE